MSRPKKVLINSRNLVFEENTEFNGNGHVYKHFDFHSNVHVLGLEPTFLHSSIMILHHFVWRNSKNTLNTYLTTIRKNKHINKSLNKQLQTKKQLETTINKTSKRTQYKT